MDLDTICQGVALLLGVAAMAILLILAWREYKDRK